MAAVETRERLLANVRPDGPTPEHRPELGPCWPWAKGTFRNGYAKIKLAGATRLAHRVAYELFIGPVPEGYELDHLCRNRPCIRPAHLEAVTHDENVKRGDRSRYGANRDKVACVHGHAFTASNTYVYPNGKRACRTCRAAAR